LTKKLTLLGPTGCYKSAHIVMRCVCALCAAVGTVSLSGWPSTWDWCQLCRRLSPLRWAPAIRL